MCVFFICILSSLSLKVFLLTLPKKKISQKISTFLPPRKATRSLWKRYKKGEKKTERRFVPLCPAARARCSFLTAREGQKHFRAYQTGAIKRRERESAFFCSDPALLFFSFFRPARAKFDNKRLQRALFFPTQQNKVLLREKFRLFRVNPIARNLPNLPPTRTTKTRCDWEFERASEFSVSFEGEFWTSDALYYSLFFVYVCTIF